jgi:methylmalonyl-CoA/ethylmalonyl-CoA epimerase
MFGKLDHVGHVVNNFEIALDLYVKKLGLEPLRIMANADAPFRSKVAFFPFAEIELELIQPSNLAGDPAARCLKERGEGIFHISFRVDDIDVEIQKWRQKGFTVTEYPVPEDNTRVAFLSPEEMKGLWIEFIAHKTKRD